jgi:hypothetical protein
MDKLNTFKTRLSKIGIKIELSLNYPWIYIDRINGKKVTEKYLGNHGFTAAFSIKDSVVFTDIDKIFWLIRMYSNNSPKAPK